MKHACAFLVVLALAAVPIAASPLGGLSDVSVLFSIGFGVNPFGDVLRFPVTLEMSFLWPSMAGLGAGFLQTGEMFLVYGHVMYGLDPFDGDSFYLPVKAKAGWGRMYGQSSWAAALSAGVGAVIPVEGTSFSKPFSADVQALATAVVHFGRADGKRFELFPEVGAGIYLVEE